MISIKYGLMGINYTTVSACSTSNTAFMDALTYIRLGKAKVIIAGGSEAAGCYGGIDRRVYGYEGHVDAQRRSTACFEAF